MVDFDNIISFHGDVILTTLKELCDEFGEPTDQDIDGKVQYEWEIITPQGIKFNIYDWKECTIPYEMEIEWHIGRTPKNGTEIGAYLAKKGFNVKNIYNLYNG